MRISNTLAIFLACTASVYGLTNEDAIYMVVEAEETLSELNAIKTGLTDLDQIAGSITIDGITYTIIEYICPVTGKTLKKLYDENNNLVREEYFDPETGISQTTEFDEEGNVKSETIVVLEEDGTASTSVTIEYKEDGSKTYILIDYTQSVDNIVTITIVAGGSITNPHDIIEGTVETMPGIPKCRCELLEQPEDEATVPPCSVFAPITRILTELGQNPESLEIIHKILPEGKLFFYCPNKMKVFRSSEVEAYITTDSNLTEMLRSSIDPETEVIKISPVMRVNLIGGDNFKITSFSPEEQSVYGESVKWKWDVVPTKLGSRKLILSVDHVIRSPGNHEDVKHLTELEREIDVNVTGKYIFDAIIALIGAMVSLIAIYEFILRLQKNNK